MSDTGQKISDMVAELKVSKPAAEGELKAGTMVMVDDGFSCIEPFSKVEVKEGDSGLYIDCAAGTHLLDGQLEKDADGIRRYIGVYLTPA